MKKRVVCTDQLPLGVSPLCASIVTIGVSDNGSEFATEQLSVYETVRQIDQGVMFYVVGLETGKVALVEKYWCIRCSKYHIRTRADSTSDNNLDSLRYCRWKAA
jgi:hypothetical protein